MTKIIDKPSSLSKLQGVRMRLSLNVIQRDWSCGNTYNNKLRDLFLCAAINNVSKEEAIAFAYETIRFYGVSVKDKDVLRQCDRAYEYAKKKSEEAKLPDGKIESIPPKAEFDAIELQKVVRRVPDFEVDELKEVSPDWAETPEEYLGKMFENGDYLFLSNSVFAKTSSFLDLETKQLPKLRQSSPEGAFFLINPVEEKGVRKNNLSSGITYRSKECLTAFRYLLVESDKVPADMWLKVLVSLDEKIVSIVSSGGKSLHALIRIDADSEEKWLEYTNSIKSRLVTLGADQGAMNSVRLSRLPFCVREETGNMQELLYLNPEADGTPIISTLVGGQNDE